MLTIDLGSPSLTMKYGAAALMSLNGAVLCRPMMVSLPIRMRNRATISIERLTPLCVLNLFNWVIPCITCIIHNDMNPTTTEFGSLFDQIFNGFIVCYISSDGDGRTAVSVDSPSGAFSLCYVKSALLFFHRL